MFVNVFPCPCFQAFLSHTVVTHMEGKQPSSCYLLLFFGALTPFRDPLGAKGNLKKCPKEEWEQAGRSWPWFPVTQFFCSLLP